MSPVPDRWRRLAGTVLILLLMPRCASREGLGGGVHMEPIKGAVKLETQYRNETFFGSSTGQPSSSTKESIFREAVVLDLKGDVYHKRLLRYSALLDLGLEQRNLTQSLGLADQKTNLTNTFFDIRGEILPENDYSGDIYAYRNQIQTRQSFFPTNDAIISEVGADARAKKWIVPSWLHYGHYTYNGRLGDKREEVRDIVRLLGSSNSDELRFDYRLEYNFIDGNTSLAPYDDYQATSSMGWNFGDDLQHSARGSAYWRKQTGPFSNEITDLTGNLDLELNEDLSWRTNTLFNQTTYASAQSVPSKKIIWDSYLEHQLFASLRSRVGVEGFEQFFGDGEVLRNGIRTFVDYQKKTTFGLLNISIRPEGYLQKESGNPDRLVPVLNESHRYTVGIPIFLDNLRVEAGSIRVTDATGLTNYVEPSDYRVQQANQATEIVIAVGSQIMPGDTILVTYRYFAGSNVEFNSVSNEVNVVFGFGELANLGLYWGVSRQSVIAGTDPGTLDDVDEIGLNWQIHHKSHGISFDFLDRNSRFTPFRRFRMDARSSFLPRTNMSVDCNGGIYRILNKDTDTWEWGLDIGGVGNWRLTNQLVFRLSAIYKRIDRSTDLGRGWYVDSRLSYDLGTTIFELRTLASQERWRVENDNNIYRVYFMVRRDF